MRHRLIRLIWKMIQARFRTFAGIGHGQRYMTFEEYLVKKRINREAFAAEDPARYRVWENMYAQMHPNSFYVSVKMMLNDVRLRYHLREEDVPKPTTTAAPRPAARRATAPIPKTEPEAPTAVPTATDVPQETTEEKSVAPAAAPKPRPVVRRPAALKPPVEGEGATAAEKPAEEAGKPAAPRARPVIKRPAALSKPDEQPTARQQEENAIPEQSDAANEASAEAPKPARPRPVIKRPAALQKPSQEGEKLQEGEKPAEAPTTGIEPASGAAPAEAPKPPRPRPIIKRPTALQKPAQEPSASDAGDKPPAPDAPQPTADAENPAQPTADTSKPPRPRPVIKRPAALAKPAAPASEPEEAKPASDGVETAPAAGEVPAEEKTPANAPAGESGIEQPAKPPRPRPIIRRPAPLTVPQETAPRETAEPEVNKAHQEAPSDAGLTAKPSVGESTLPEEQNEKPKPPRPRPIMRRPPPKTEK
ncbi:hypothetical protein [uncultured Pontibacter sp.]|uniref:hypothetical protein n=1 Tax=uncultured Pontibacter sp. TaxID=453356 RepID=UPI0026184DE9|nr:hypothetical protein [uncultured Pontibacter sp.]